MNSFLRIFIFQLLCATGGTLTAASGPVKAAEMAEATRWAAAKLQGQEDTRPAAGYLLVTLENGTIGRNQIKGRQLRIVDKVFEHGMHMPADGKVVVHLPAPGKTFEAVAGVDSNDVEYYDVKGRGTVIAIVDVAGKEAFRSQVLREGMVGVPVKVDLAGASDLTLTVNDAGDGTEWDQADWADARVTLTDGRTVWLADLPLGPLRSPYTADLTFSFRYSAQSSRELLKTWEVKRSERTLDPVRREVTLILNDPKTGLEVRSVGVMYQDFPVVEWTLYFKNTGTVPTPILEDIQALDTRFERNAEGEFLLHHSRGAPARPTDYQPFETILKPKDAKVLHADGGRPTNGDLCFFNLEWPGEGVIISVGWPGQWKAELQRDEKANGIQIRAGQELTHFKLLAGEEVRTPLVTLLFWQGEWIRSQNLWRRWMIADNIPHAGGSVPAPQTAAYTGRVHHEMQEATEENQKMFIDRYLEEGIKPDYWWMDAGWYPFKKSWSNVGTWDPDPNRFPHGLRAISDYAHAKGMKTLLWFEPERVTPGTWLFEHHPEWLLSDGNKGSKLLDLGNNAARLWLTDHVDKVLREQGIDLYRQDFNMDPLNYWRAHDAADRQGITEIGHATGYLAYWDELRRRHPDMLIDTCASGGRRNDLETLRRAVPLWRSDFVFETTPMQNFTYGMALWIPYFGTAFREADPYAFRSMMVPSDMLNLDVRRRDLDYGQWRKMLAQRRQVAEYFYGDFYPLTTYSTEDNVWCAWQFDRPDLHGGMVQAFRRPQSPFEAAHFKLRDLEPTARYRVTNFDEPGTAEMTGRELMEDGLPVVLKRAPQSAIIAYKQVDGRQ
jgi:alpha-galactosidase